MRLLGRELANGNTLMKSFLRDIKWNLKLKWLYRFFTQIVYEHLLPVNYIVSKEGISRYDSNRNLFEIIKLQIIYYPRMDRDVMFILPCWLILKIHFLFSNWSYWQKEKTTHTPVLQNLVLIISLHFQYNVDMKYSHDS